MFKQSSAHTLVLHFARSGVQGNTKWLTLFGPVSNYLNNYDQMERDYLVETDLNKQGELLGLLSGGYSWRSQATPKLESVLSQIESLGSKIEFMYVTVHTLTYLEGASRSIPWYVLVEDSLFELKPAEWCVFVPIAGTTREPCKYKDIADILSESEKST